MSGGAAPVRMTREEIAQRDIGHTDISRRLAWLMTVAFLLTLLAPPIVQLAYDLGPGQEPGAGGRTLPQANSSARCRP